jgi:hypothetical protein
VPTLTNEAGIPTLPEDLSSPPVSSGFLVARSLVFYIVCYRLVFVPSSCSVDHYIVCSPLLVIILSVLLCWSLYCLFSSVGLYIVCSAMLVIMLSVLLCCSFYCMFSSFGHSFVCFPLLVIILSVLLCWS